MPKQEKQAWYMLIVVVATLAAYAAFIRFVRFDPVSIAVFALSGFLGVRITKRRHGEIEFDERDREIERRALLAALRVGYTVLLIPTVVVTIAKGDNYSVPLWFVMQCVWGGSLAMFGLRSALVIAAYRKDAHAGA
jgi:uncharacterized membrane protein